MSGPVPHLATCDASVRLLCDGAVVGHATLRELDAQAYQDEKTLGLSGPLTAELLALEGPVLSLDDLEVRDRPERGRGFGESQDAGAELLEWYARQGFLVLPVQERKLSALLIRPVDV